MSRFSFFGAFKAIDLSQLVLTFDSATMSQTRKGKLGCNVESSRLMMGNRRSKSPRDLSASSIATLVDGSGRFRLIDFCKMDFKTGT